jgi:hypothetical protein
MSNVSLLKAKMYLEALQKAKKAAGQFVEIPEWMKLLKNVDQTLESSQRAQAKRILTGAGKISPEDMNTLISNRNLDILHMLSSKKDLTAENARRILDSNEGFERTRHLVGPNNQALLEAAKSKYNVNVHNGRDSNAAIFGFNYGYGYDKKRNKKKDETYSNLIAAVKGAGGMDEFLKNGGEDAVNWTLAEGKNHHRLSPEQLLHIVTERPQISSEMMYNMARHDDFDNGHMVEVLNRPESYLKQEAFRSSRTTMSPDIINAIFRSDDAGLVGSLISGDQAAHSLTAQQLNSVLKHRDPSVRKRAHEILGDHAWKNANFPTTTLAGMVKDVIRSSSDNDLKEFLGSYDSYWGRDSKPDLSVDQVSDLTQRLMASPEATRSDMADSKKIKFSQVQKEAIAKAVLNHYNSQPEANKGFGYSTPSAFGFVERLANNSNFMDYATEDMINHMIGVNPAIGARMYSSIINSSKDERNNLTPEHIDKMYDQGVAWSKKDSYNKIGSLLSAVAAHPKTHPDTIMKMIGGDISSVPSSVLQTMVTGDKLPRDQWENLIAKDNDLMALASTSPHVNDQDITKALTHADKHVRGVWIKQTPESKFKPEHWELIKKDRSAINRAIAASRSDVPDDAFQHFLINDKSAGVNRSALNNDAVTPEVLDAAVAKMNPHNLTEIGTGDKLSVDQHKILFSRLAEDRVSKLAKVNKKAKEGKLTPEELTSEIDKIKATYELSMKHMAKHKNLDDDMVAHIFASTPSHGVNDTINQLRHNDVSISNDNWESLLDKTDLNERTVDNIMRQARLSPDKWRKVASNLTPSEYENEQGIQKHIASNPSVPSDVFDRFVNHGHIGFLSDVLGNNKNLTSDQIRQIFGKIQPYSQNMSRDQREATGDAIKSMAENSNTPEDVVEALFEKMSLTNGDLPHLATGFYGHDDYESSRIRQELADHSNANMRVLSRAVNDRDDRVRRAAEDKMAQHNPDGINEAIGGHDIHVHPAVEKLKHLKGVIQEMGNGEPIAKGKLPNKGQGIPNEVFDNKGQISPKTIDEYIDKLPKDRYNISYSKWSGAQRHDRNKDQLVMQINLTNKHVQDMKDAGLWNVFQDIHKASYRSGHPVRKHSLGWARLDMSHSGHAHIDEIQSDLGQGSIRMVEKAVESGSIDRAKGDEYVNGIKGIVKMLSGQFKNINQVIAAAVHQTFREKEIKDHDGSQKDPIKSTSYDKIDDQATQSGMTTKARVSDETLKNFYNNNLYTESHDYSAVKHWVKKNNVENNPEIGMEKFKEQFPDLSTTLEVPVPGFFQETYKQMPESMGYKDMNKKEAMPDTEAPEAELQYRKLVKSLTKIKQIAKMLKEREQK